MALWAWLLIGAGVYLSCAIWIGSLVAAEFIRENRKGVAKGKKDDDDLTEEQGGQVITGGVFWWVVLPFIIGGYITDHLVREETEVKCILCGTKSPSTAMHCHHCGNQMKGVV